MNYFDGEKEILRSDNDELVLTNIRVRQSIYSSGFAKISSMMLEEVSGCETTYRSQPIFLIVAIIALIAALGFLIGDSQNLGAIVLSGLAAAASALCFFRSRRQVLSISAGIGRIDSRITRERMETCEQFIDALEKAKNERYTLRISADRLAAFVFFDIVIEVDSVLMNGRRRTSFGAKFS